MIRRAMSSTVQENQDVSLVQTMQNNKLSATVVQSSGCLAPTNGRVCTEECNAAPHVVQFFIDTDLHCCAADNWKKTLAVDNTRAEHWCTLQNHFANGGVKTKMSSPSVVRETRDTASTVSNHARTSADNGLQKIASGSKKCRSTMFDATPHAVHLPVRPVLRFLERQTKQKSKNMEKRIPTWKGEGCILWVAWRLT